MFNGSFLVIFMVEEDDEFLLYTKIRICVSLRPLD